MAEVVEAPTVGERRRLELKEGGARKAHLKREREQMEAEDKVRAHNLHMLGRSV